MSALPAPRFTPEEYLERERAANFKSEYWNGQIVAMAGAREAHNLVVANVIGELRARLKGKPCKTYPSDMKVECGPAGLYTYPDVSVVCGAARFHDMHTDMLQNPIVVIEVLSPSTEDYDRGDKFAQYQRIETLQEYVLVATAKRRVEHYQRQEDRQWRLTVLTEPADALSLPALELTVPLSELYDRVEL